MNMTLQHPTAAMRDLYNSAKKAADEGPVVKMLKPGEGITQMQIKTGGNIALRSVKREKTLKKYEEKEREENHIREGAFRRFL